MLRECPIDHRCMTGLAPARVLAAVVDGRGAFRMTGGRPAVFLDRDGTLIEERGYLDRLELLDDASRGPADAIRLLNRAGFAMVVITNQSAIGRGIIDEPFLHDACTANSTATLAPGGARRSLLLLPAPSRRALSRATAWSAAAGSRPRA